MLRAAAAAAAAPPAPAEGGGRAGAGHTMGAGGAAGEGALGLRLSPGAARGRRRSPRLTRRGAEREEEGARRNGAGRRLSPHRTHTRAAILTSSGPFSLPPCAAPGRAGRRRAAAV